MITRATLILFLIVIGSRLYSQASVEIIGPRNTCQNEEVTLFAQVTNCNPPYQIVWMPGNLSGQTITLPTSIASTTAYTVYVTNTECSLIDTATITVFELPTAVIPPLVPSCGVACYNVSAQSNINLSSWLWSFGDGSSSTLPQPTHCYSSPGVYNIGLSVVDTNGCSNSLSFNNWVEVYPNPIAGFVQNVNGYNVQLTDVSLGSNIISYYWDFGDGNFSSSQNPSHTYASSNAGPHIVTLVVMNIYGCTDTVSSMIEIVSLDEINNYNSILVFPVPARDNLFVKSYNNKILNFTINDALTTKEVCLFDANQTKLLNQHYMLNIDFLPEGIYFLKTTDLDRQVIMSKFIIAR